MALNNGFEYREQIGASGAGRTVLEHLSSAYAHSSEAQWRERLRGGEVFLDGLQTRWDCPLKPGQWLVWKRPPWDEPDVPLGYAVLYQDRDMLAVAKPCGLPTLPAGGFLDHTLLALVRRSYPEATPVQRLGRGTSGIVLFARTAQARSALCRALRQNEASKTYRALAGGIPAAEAFSIHVPIGPVPHPRLGTLHAASPNGKPASSHVKLLERRGEVSLLEVCIDSGKPHQIRIHLAAAGYPLIGDPLYSTGGGFKRPADALPGDLGYLLHAERIRLRHPATGRAFEVWCCPPPELRL